MPEPRRRYVIKLSSVFLTGCFQESRLFLELGVAWALEVVQSNDAQLNSIRNTKMREHDSKIASGTNGGKWACIMTVSRSTDSVK